MNSVTKYNLDRYSNDKEFDIYSTWTNHKLRIKIMVNFVDEAFSKTNKNMKNFKILDIGGNTGVISNILQEKGYNVTVADISEEALKACKKRNLKTISFDFNNTFPIKEKTYDLVDGQEIKADAYHAAYGDPDYEQWLEDYNQNQNCSADNSILGSYDDPNSVAYFLQIIFNWMKLIGPFIVVVMSGIEFTKIIVTGDEDGMKKAKNKLIVRLILVALLFFLPDLIKAFLELFNITSSGICGLN